MDLLMTIELFPCHPVFNWVCDIDAVANFAA